MKRWSSSWHWVERRDAWMAETDRVARLEQIEAIKQMNRRHAEQAMELQTNALLALKSLDTGKMSATEIIRFIIDASRLERTARGEPEKIQQTQVAGLDGEPLQTANVVVYLPDNKRDNRDE